MAVTIKLNNKASKNLTYRDLVCGGAYVVVRAVHPTLVLGEDHYNGHVAISCPYCSEHGVVSFPNDHTWSSADNYEYRKLEPGESITISG